MTKGPSLSPPQLMPFLEPHGVMLYLLEGKIPKPDENWFMTNQDRQVENESTLLNKRIVLLGGSSGIGLLSHGKLWSRGRMRLLHQAIKRAFNKLLIALAARPKGVGSIFPTISSIELFFRDLEDFDHLVYTAGDTLQLDELAAMDFKKARGAFELRFWSALAAVKYASPHIREGESIVLTTGVASLRPRKGWAVAPADAGRWSRSRARWRSNWHRFE